MSKNIVPYIYIGVTGFTQRVEVDNALKHVPTNHTHRLMVGVLMSNTTLRGEKNKWPYRYPLREKVADIFSPDPRTLNLVHYNTDDPGTLFDQMVEVQEKYAGPYCDGFQLNMAWPHYHDLERYKAKFPDSHIILELGPEALAEKELELAGRLKVWLNMYRNCVDTMLADLSAGTGKPLEPMLMASILQAITETQFSPAVAGGLGPRSLYLIDPLIKRFPNLSIDAQQQLRIPRTDTLNSEYVRMYLQDAFIKLSGKELPGMQFEEFGTPYGFDGHFKRKGSGDNLLRLDEWVCQPCALKIGDMLATGEEVISLPREGGNGKVWIHLQDPEHRNFDGDWIDVPARIPIALKGKN